MNQSPGQLDSRKRQTSSESGKKTLPEAKAEPDKSLLAAVNNVSTYVQKISRDIHLYVDGEEGDPVVLVVDSGSGRTIRTIPPKEVMTISRHIDAEVSDPIKGLLVRNKV
ncbi:MAG: flagellar protein FlaG [Pseudomonadota bacterium]